MRPPDNTDDRISFISRQLDLYHLHIVELAAHGCHAVINGLILHLGVYLRSLYVAVAEHFGYYLDGHVVAERHRREGMARHMEYTRQSKRQRTGKN